MLLPITVGSVVRFILAIFAIWFAILLTPEHPTPEHSVGRTIKEKVWLSQSCTDSHWYLEDSDEQTATLMCYQPD